MLCVNFYVRAVIQKSISTIMYLPIILTSLARIEATSSIITIVIIINLALLQYLYYSLKTIIMVNRFFK